MFPMFRRRAGEPTSRRGPAPSSWTVIELKMRTIFSSGTPFFTRFPRKLSEIATMRVADAYAASSSRRAAASSGPDGSSPVDAAASVT